MWPRTASVLTSARKLRSPIRWNRTTFLSLAPLYSLTLLGASTRIVLRVSTFSIDITSWDLEAADMVYSPAGSVVFCTENSNGIVAVASVCAWRPLAPSSATAPALRMIVFNVFIFVSPLFSSKCFSRWITSHTECNHSAKPGTDRTALRKSLIIQPIANRRRNARRLHPAAGFEPPGESSNQKVNNRGCDEPPTARDHRPGATRQLSDRH